MAIDLTTREGIVALMEGSKSTHEWTANCKKVKAANNGDYPSFWYEAIVMSGISKRVLEACGSDDQIHASYEDTYRGTHGNASQEETLGDRV